MGSCVHPDPGQWETSGQRSTGTRSSGCRAVALACRATGRGFCLTSALLLDTPRSAAIFSSKTCLLWEVGNMSCDTSEEERPVETAAFYTKFANQLSTFKKPPSSAPLALGSCVRVNPNFSLPLPQGPAQCLEVPSTWCQTGCACTSGLFHILATVYFSN